MTTTTPTSAPRDRLELAPARSNPIARRRLIRMPVDGDLVKRFVTPTPDDEERTPPHGDALLAERRS